MQASSAFWQAVEAWTRYRGWVSQKALYDFARAGLNATLEHSSVNAAELSRDGRHVLTIGRGMKVWKTDGTSVFSSRADGASAVGSGDFSPDGSLVAFASASAEIFNIKGDKQFELGGDWEAMWFSSDGKYLFTAALGAPIQRWDRTGRRLNEYRHEGNVSCFARSADGSIIAAGSDRGDVYLWTVEGQILKTFHEAGAIISVEFAKDGAHLLSLTESRLLTLHAVGGIANNQVLDRGAIAAAISPQGNQVAVLNETAIRFVGFDGATLRTLETQLSVEPPQPEPATLRRAYRLIGSYGRAAIQFLNGGRYLAISSKSATNVWALEAGQMIKALDGRLLAALPDEKNLVVTTGKDSAGLFALGVAELLQIPHKSVISALAFSPSDGSFLTASLDGQARFWDAAGNLSKSVAHGAALTSVAFSHNGQRALTVGRDNTVRLWSRGGELLEEFRHANIVNQAAFAFDDTRIVTSSSDGTAAVWTERGDRIATLDHKSEVYCAAFSPNGQLIATGAADHLVRVWSANSGLLHWQMATTDNVVSISFSADGQRIVATTTGNQILVLEPGSGHVLATLRHPDEVRATEVMAAQDRVITSAADRVVRVWDMAGNLLAQLPHPKPVSSLALSSDGMRILTGSADGRARLWDLSGNELLTFVDGDNVLHVAFSKDGETVITASNHKVTVWNFGSPQSIVGYYSKSVAKPPPLPGEISN